jgi:hypothetical protein
VVAKVMNDLNVAMAPTAFAVPETIITPKKRGRPAKNHEASK